MADDSFLYQLAQTKQKIERDFITQYLEHEPSREERKRFTTVHRLNETLIYFKGDLIGHLRYYSKDGTLFAEYLDTTT